MGHSCDDEWTCEQIRSLYTELALHPEKDFGWLKGKENARSLGYDKSWLDRLPEFVWESSAMVGNPFTLGPIRLSGTVIDLGCGAGADVCVAALLVGEAGKVHGVDVTQAMVEKSRDNVKRCGFPNIEIHQSDMAELPLEDGIADVVISNGAMNLSTRKPCVLKEAFRILKPGGRLQIADMVRDENYSFCEADEHASWANCVAGTISIECFSDMMREAGFDSVEFVAYSGYKTSAMTIGATFKALRPLVNRDG